MSNTTVKVQIPLDKSLRDAIDKHARQLGFSSVQDFTRVMYSAVVRDKLKFSLKGSEELSPAAETRYEKMTNLVYIEQALDEADAYADTHSEDMTHEDVFSRIREKING